VKCVILQPSYVPWRGVFDQVRRADTFVFYDDVQYDARGWRNRNRIKTAQGSRWLTIPVHARGAQVEGTPIDRIEIDWTQDWSRKHLTALRHAYARAPFLDGHLPLLEEHLARRPRLLADLTIDLTIALARELGLTGTRFLRSSSLGVTGTKTARLLAILEKLGATQYLSGPSARAYLDEALLAQAGITVEYLRYEYPEYEQLHPPFDPHVSILDLLFMQGPDAPRFLGAP
jgi:hypothetical protein